MMTDESWLEQIRDRAEGLMPSTWSDEVVLALLNKLDTAEADRNSNAVALAQAVLRADKADAKVLAVEDALVEEEFMLDGEMYISVESVRRALRGK